MVIPFPVHCFVKTPQPCSQWSNLGVGLSTAFVSLLCLLLMPPAEAWHCFTLGWVFFQCILWAWVDQSNKNLRHNWAKILWEKMGMGARRFPNKWCTFLWPCCWFTPVCYKNDTPWPPLMFIFLNCLSFQLSGRNSPPHCSKQRQQELTSVWEKRNKNSCFSLQGP